MTKQDEKPDRFAAEAMRALREPRGEEMTRQAMTPTLPPSEAEARELPGSPKMHEAWLATLDKLIAKGERVGFHVDAMQSLRDHLATLPPQDSSGDAREEAKRLLAEAVGVPVKSGSDIDLGDYHQVFVADALRAIEAALSPSQDRSEGVGDTRRLMPAVGREVDRRLGGLIGAILPIYEAYILKDCGDRGGNLEIPVSDLRDLVEAVDALDSDKVALAALGSQDRPAPVDEAAVERKVFQRRADDCVQASLATLLGLPLDQVPRFDEEANPGKNQLGLVRTWLRSIGYGLHPSTPLRLEGRYLAHGESPRGFAHTVVFESGELFHDPHPEGGGVEGPNESWLIYPLDPRAALTASPPSSDGLKDAIQRVVDEGDGFWKSCSGCVEGVDGCVSATDYPFDPVFQCQRGGGCGDCGGLGAVWFEVPSEDWCRQEAQRSPFASDGLTIPDEARDALEWFGKQQRLELYFYSPTYGDDDDQAEEWRVDDVSGSVNDREWTTVGRGETPIAAIVAARQALSDQEPSHG